MFLKKEMFAVFIHRGISILNFLQIIKLILNAFKNIDYNFQLFFSKILLRTVNAPI